MPATAIITTVPTFRTYYPIAFSSDEAGLPDMAAIERTYIVPILGQDLYDAILANIADAGRKTLVDLVRRAEAPLAVYDDIINRAVLVTDAGLKQLSSEQTQPVFRWQYNETRAMLETRISRALDALWQHLYLHGADYDWQDSSPYTLCIKTAGEFAQLYPMHEPYRVWSLLKPLLYQVESFSVNSLIGAPFFAELKADTELTAEEAEAMMKIKMAVAYLTITKAITHLRCKITDKGFTVLFNGTADQPTDGQQNAPDQQMSLLYDECTKTGAAWLKQVKTLLDSKASAEVFATYFASTYYKPPGEQQKVDRNAGKRTFRLT